MKNKVTHIVIHCSDSSFGNAALLGKWHLQREWSGIGYHYIILNGFLTPGTLNKKYNGHVETGRPLDNDSFLNEEEKGAGVYGMNSNTVHICLIGKTTFTTEQYESLIYLLRDDLCKQFPGARVVGHYQLDKHGKTCPNFNVQNFVSDNNIYPKK